MSNYNKITALYSRLSVGDEDRDGGESNSIQNQKIFLENYAKGQHLTNIRHYIDDDESGRFFDRSAYLKPTSNGRRIVFPKDFADIAAFTTTCDWCVYNRIFVSRTAEWGEMEEGVLDISTYYYEANPASVLLDNINAARQTWNYG